MKIEYLLFDLLIFFLSTFASYLFPDRKLPQLKPALLSLLCVTLPFIFWDALVVNHWWSFNQSYTLGFKIFSLPIEELLFFLVVPWSCLVIWVNLQPFFAERFSFKLEPLVLLVGFVIFLVGLKQNWNYTLLVGCLVIFFAFLSMVNRFWLSTLRSLLFLFCVTLFTFIFNGYLTARPIVRYNDQVLSRVRVLSIPIEDFGYGLILVGLIALLYDVFQKNDK